MQNIDLTVRPQCRDDLASWYTAALKDQVSSGLSVADYADQLGVTAATLYQWKRRLSADDAAEFETPRSLGLVEVALDSLPPTRPTDPIVVRLGRDRYVELPSRFDDEDLIRLIEILESC
jgi:hypothetical protein